MVSRLMCVPLALAADMRLPSQRGPVFCRPIGREAAEQLRSVHLDPRFLGGKLSKAQQGWEDRSRAGAGGARPTQNTPDRPVELPGGVGVARLARCGAPFREDASTIRLCPIGGGSA